MTPPFTPTTRRVEIVTFHNVQVLDATGPFQVFASANGVVEGAYSVHLIARSGRIETSSGLALAAEPLGPEAEPIDTLIIAGGEGVHAACKDAGLVRWLKARASQARRVSSVCTGAFLLGAIGVLDGRRAVTHWMNCDELARRHPTAHVEVDPIFIQDGDLWTSAGVTSGIDMALAMVEADLGYDVAMDIARDLVVFLKRPGGQSQFSAALSLQSRSQTMASLLAWMACNLDKDLCIGNLAERAGMSERSFSRHFVAATGETPSRALERLRIEAAQRLLTGGQTPIKTVAARCGFPSEEA